MPGSASSARQVTSGQPYSSTRDPASVNPRYAPHRELAQADGFYFESHALTSYRPTVEASLPASLSVSTSFPQSVLKAIDPADEHWTTPALQSVHKTKHYWHKQWEIDQAFDCAMADLNGLIDALLNLGLQEQLPELVRSGLNTLKQQAGELQTRVTQVRDLGYTYFAQVLLQIADLLQLALRHLDDDWVKDIEANLLLSLEYPVSDSNSYTLQLNYYFCGRTQTGDDEAGYILCGIRLGRSQQWNSRSGAKSVVYLAPSQITTTFHAASDPAQAAPGFVCSLNIQ